MTETAVKRARDKCYRLLAYRSRTVREIQTRLEQAGFSEPVIKKVVAELAEKKLLDDHSYARDWIRHRLAAKPVGAGYLRARLLQKGIDREIIADALREYDEDSEYEAAKRLIYGKVNPNTSINWRRLTGLLARRGFSSAVINRIYYTIADDGRFDIS